MKDKKDKKEIVVHVRMTADEFEKLTDKAEKSGLSVSELIRVCCSKKQLRCRVSTDEQKILMGVIDLKNALTWLNNSYKSSNFDEVKKWNIYLINELHKIISKFK